jgi:hypothetical protein
MGASPLRRLQVYGCLNAKQQAESPHPRAAMLRASLQDPDQHSAHSRHSMYWMQPLVLSQTSHEGGPRLR